VGSAFTNPRAKQELDTIASKPAGNFVFQVGSFDALNKIQESLQAKIFSIEGSQTSGEALKQEMSQEGFRAAYVSGEIQMAMVGVNQWKGGYKKYSLSSAQTTGSFEPSFMEVDSYLGYSMTIAKTAYGPLTVIGAPRYQHKGVVLTVFNQRLRDKIKPFPPQTGEYFGAEVCAMDVDSDGLTDLVLISSLMHKQLDREGRVYVCKLTRLVNVKCLPLFL
ncbi:hypothetical protein ATANTOWER_025411, partial [Ataeniobius toweri]|nr:hypothetical protein [Ataeniobius toweri]